MRAAAEMSGEALASNMAYFEAQFVPGRDVETGLWDAEARRDHLISLHAYGFNAENYAQTIDEIVDIGLPVRNFTSLHRRPNKDGSEDYLGTWGTGTDNYGEFSLYELLDKYIPEERLATIVHESVHANTPLRVENADLYGGESERAEAARHVWAVTEQSLATDVHLDGYHKALIRKYRNGIIDKDTLAEETSAIMAEMAITNRYGLGEVQERQQRKLEDLNRINRLQGQPERRFVPLISREDKAGTVLAGVDITLVRLIEGVNNHAELVAHARSLKAKLYRPENFAVVEKREEYRQQPVSAPHIALHGLAGFMQQHQINKRNRRKLESLLSLDSESIDELDYQVA